MKEYILCSANHYDDGEKEIHGPKNIESGFVICGMRHHTVLKFLPRWLVSHMTKKVLP